MLILNVKILLKVCNKYSRNKNDLRFNVIYESKVMILTIIDEIYCNS